MELIAFGIGLFLASSALIYFFAWYGVAAVAVYVIGFAISIGVSHAIAENEGSDTGLTGNEIHEFLSWAAWPLFWPGYVAYRMLRKQTS